MFTNVLSPDSSSRGNSPAIYQGTNFLCTIAIYFPQYIVLLRVLMFGSMLTWLYNRSLYDLMFGSMLTRLYNRSLYDLMFVQTILAKQINNIHFDILTQAYISKCLDNIKQVSPNSRHVFLLFLHQCVEV